MDFSLSDEDRELVDMVDRVAMEQFRPKAFEDREAYRRPVENMRILGRPFITAGWIVVGVTAVVAAVEIGLLVLVLKI